MRKNLGKKNGELGEAGNLDLVADIRGLIEQARKAVAVAVNAELTQREESAPHDTVRVGIPGRRDCRDTVATIELERFFGADEEADLRSLNEWIQARDLLQGRLACEHVDPATGIQQAVFDLAWSGRIQEHLSQPVAVLLNEPAEVLAIASQAGIRCFTSTGEFKDYVRREILAENSEVG